jgi:hypothetical protein
MKTNQFITALRQAPAHRLLVPKFYLGTSLSWQLHCPPAFDDAIPGEALPKHSFENKYIFKCNLGTRGARREGKKTTENNNMTTQEFITTLRKSPANRLIFVSEDGDVIHAGYHLTEIKAAHFDTVDCGGQTNRWNETVVQLWVPAEADDDYMTAGKFLSIFDRVTAMIPLQEEAEIRVEYGDENFFPSLYHVEAVKREAGTTRVMIVPPVTTCKARDRRLKTLETVACCQPVEANCC